MVTVVEGNNLVKLLENIKSRNGTTNLFEHLNKMYEVKKEMNDDEKYSDLFEDISIRIKKEGEIILIVTIGRYILYCVFLVILE